MRKDLFLVLWVTTAVVAGYWSDLAGKLVLVAPFGIGLFLLVWVGCQVHKEDVESAKKKAFEISARTWRVLRVDALGYPYYGDQVVVRDEHGDRMAFTVWGRPCLLNEGDPLRFRMAEARHLPTEALSYLRSELAT